MAEQNTKMAEREAKMVEIIEKLSAALAARNFDRFGGNSKWQQGKLNSARPKRGNCHNCGESGH